MTDNGMSATFTERVLAAIRRIPPGRVATYGSIALAAGNPRGARQVARLLHSSSVKHNLPWQRVVNRAGCIALPRGEGYELQKQLLETEGVEFGAGDTIDLERYLWSETGLPTQ